MNNYVLHLAVRRSSLVPKVHLQPFSVSLMQMVQAMGHTLERVSGKDARKNSMKFFSYALTLAENDADLKPTFAILLLGQLTCRGQRHTITGKSRIQAHYPCTQLCRWSNGYQPHNKTVKVSGSNRTLIAHSLEGSANKKRGFAYPVPTFF